MTDLFLSLGLAVAAGLLIGLERERSAPQTATFLGGARTHPLFALAGGLSTLLARQLGAGLPLVAFGALLAFVIANYVEGIRRGSERGLTSEVAFMISFLLGALALTQGVIEPTSERMFVVLAAAVVATVLLSSKPTIHPIVQRASAEDVTSTLKFLIVAVIVVPLLPDRVMGPLNALNPRHVGLIVLLIASVSFLGYVAIRLLGPERGLGLTGIVGGIASSTAVALSLSPRAREKPELARPLALAVLLASTIMFPRIVLLVGAINSDLFRMLVIPMGTMLAMGLAVSYVLYLLSKRRSSMEQGQARGGGGGNAHFANPFELRSALKFGLFFSAVIIATKGAAVQFGSAGVYAAGALAGLADVDVIAVSMADLSRSTVQPRVAATTIVIAAISNTAMKATLAAVLGGLPFVKRLALPFALVMATGALSLWLTLGR